jgi:gamma-tubulin complex component 3
MNSLNSESNLRLVNYRRKIPYSASSDSVLDGQTPDSDLYTFNYSQNEELVQEAIYALTGKAGKFLKKDVTGEFKLDIKARCLNAQEALSLLRLSETGRLHNDIHKYTDPNSEFFLFGLFGQGLIAQIQVELTQFYGLIAHLQDNVSRRYFYMFFSQFYFTCYISFSSIRSVHARLMRSMNHRSRY